MLVLSRRAGDDGKDKIVIGDVVITILEVRGKVVRIGVEAPNGVKIFRSECVDSD